MKGLFKLLSCTLASLSLAIGNAYATDNQTDDLSTILPGSQLPFKVVIEKANFQLPIGLHSGVVGVYNGLWVFIAGRTNGLHGFSTDPFPPEYQNRNIYVVNPNTGRVVSRSLADPSSGLNQQQIDSLSVTSPQGYQDGNKIIMTGGYGIDTGSSTYGTKSLLTVINLPGIVNWVMHPQNKNYSVVKNISQISNPIFQVTGGKMVNINGLTQIVFGQDFEGVYSDSSNGNYIQQIRQFIIKNNGKNLSVTTAYPIPFNADSNYRRRDLNVVPVILKNNNRLEVGMVAYAGVFTNAGGVWTVPVVIKQNGNPVMADPNLSTTFKQGMNQYVCATAGLYSKKYKSMYNIFFGGISYGYYQNGQFTTDSEDPFINQVTTIQMDDTGSFTQYLMDSQYPTILSTQTNPGNILYFGAGAYFIENQNITQYANKVMSLDHIKRPTVIGYIVGGIQSTVPNTGPITDSTGSTYIFKVTLIPTG